MKKLVPLAVALVAIGLFSAGCSGKPEGEAATSPAADASTGAGNAPNVATQKTLSDQATQMQSEEAQAAARVAKKRGLSGNGAPTAP